ncbi:MAG: zinc ribbon domain-containing protein [Firmicutes bacterium]|nr:zinc ribbon domain-containing protein [Bacillota bacterium]
MPIFEYQCQDCQKTFEVLQLPGNNNEPKCECGSANLRKLISSPFLPSSVGKPANEEPASCCGSNPKEGNCTPGSCCGKTTDE